MSIVTFISAAFSPSISSSFPHLKQFATLDGRYTNLRYVDRLLPHDLNQAVFKPLAQIPDYDGRY
jgi:hypothetical protein